MVAGLASISVWLLLLLLFDRSLAGAKDLCVSTSMKFCVNDSVDESDATPGDGMCATAVNKCTLRAAIEEATALGGLGHPRLGGFRRLGGPRHIVLQDLRYPLNKELEIKSPAYVSIESIRGSSGETVITPAQANGVTRVLHIHQGARVTLQNLSIKNGDVSKVGSARGGGIYNKGTLTVTDCRVANNHSGAGGGGGIYNEGILTMKTSVIRDNNSKNHGGGINHTHGTITIQDSTIIDNTATSGGGGIQGGASMTIVRSTLARNNAQYGGGLSQSGNASVTVLVENSTLSGNSAQSGSAIGNNGAIMKVVSSTIAHNSFKGWSPSEASTIRVNTGSVTLKNSILYDPQMKSSCRFQKVSGAVISGGYNIIHPHINPSPAPSQNDIYDCPLIGTDRDVDPELDPQLIENPPGRTATHALLGSSPARDGIPSQTPNGSPPVDQRGVTRPQPTNISNSAFDIGAFEYN